MYRIQLSAIPWYLRYLKHHLEHSRMKRETFDLCCLIRRYKDNVEELILLQVYDLFGFRSQRFFSYEEEQSKNVRCKRRTHISENAATFNGIIIRKNKDNNYYITQTDKNELLEQATSQQTFNNQRALSQFIVVKIRPEYCAQIHLISSGN